MEELDYLYGLRRGEGRADLSFMRRLLDLLGNPQDAFASVLIAGTNGKGSVTAMIAQILQEAGYIVGRYTSPHLTVFNERIVIGGVRISDADILRLIAHIKDVAARNGLHLTFAEFVVAMAFCHFRENGVEIAVVEVGMGGRLDPTNTLAPLVSIITSIGLDHMQHLGSTTAQIAQEKAGIIKKGTPLVTGVRDAHLLEIFKSKGSDVIIPQKPAFIAEDLDGQTFRYGGMMYRCALLGAHQQENAAISLAAIAVLRATWDIPDDAITQGLATVSWPGRFQIVARDPLVIIDGAHNEDGARALAAQVAKYAPHTLVVGIGARKEARTILAILAPLFSRIICTQGSYEPLAARDLARIAEEFCAEVCVEEDPVRATQQACAAGKTVVVAGSLYMIPAVIDHFTRS